MVIAGVRVRRQMSAAVALLAIAAAGCELENTVVPRTEPGLVVHAILDARLFAQSFVVERTLTGSQNIGSSSSPITSTGIPVSGAVVTVTDQTGFVRTGVETPAKSGIYVVPFDVTNPVRQGWRYDLSVIADGKTVTGSTVVPTTTGVSFPRRSFNRDHDTLRIDAPDDQILRALWLRIETGEQPFELLSADRHLRVAGQIRNPNTDDLLRVFHPGFLQQVTVVAVDTNVYDYYRSGNDPFTGTGLITHLTGGFGVFGAVAALQRLTVDVTQDPTGDPIEGRYTLRRGVGVGAIASEFTLYLDAPGNGTDAVSGLFLTQGGVAPSSRGSVAGTRTGSEIDLTLSSDARFLGIVRGDSLIGAYSGISATYVRSGR
jgi:hypothetical protein